MTGWPMFEVRFNLADFERQAKVLHGALDQVPFALSLALNDAIKQAREELVSETWPQHVTQRNATFIKRALRINFSTKRNLRAEVYDDLGRAHLKLHAKGGVKQGKHRLAIPPKGAVRRGAHGVVKSQRPAQIIANTPKRALRVTPRGILVGKGGKLYLKYSFRPSANQPADVPFDRDFEAFMLRQVRASFPAALVRAMKSRR